MAELSRRARRLFVLVHVVVSVGWLGAGAANVALAATAPLDDAVQAHAAVGSIRTIDTWVVIPAAFSALATGIVLSLFTAWGLFRHWWVLVKLVLTVAVILFSTFGVGAWVEQLYRTTAGSPLDPRTAHFLIGGAFGNLAGFVTMTWLSISKPRGLTPWAARAKTQPLHAGIRRRGARDVE